MYENIAVGQKVERITTITDQLIEGFAAVTGDDNPVHLDEKYASKSFFRKRVAHGFLTASLAIALLGTELPGPGSIFLTQELEFKNPVFPGDTLTVAVEVLEKDDSVKKVLLRTFAKNQNGRLVLDGRAWILVR
jgi:3-hydroxybutyryl-CoA dehydratase